MEKMKLQEILDKHLKWLRGEPDGERANLSGTYLSDANLTGANLSGADLYGANLSGTDLSDANLTGANLSGANLSGTYLSGADLSDADLYGANLTGANLSGTYLSGADLSDADLYGANLTGANLSGTYLSDANLTGANLSDAKGIEKTLNLFYPIACPSDGAFIGWKKARCGGTDCIVKLRIPENARRSSATGRKCRCDMAEVLEVQTIDGEKIDSAARSGRDANFLYKVGETVFVSDYCENRWEECAAGIHFYITREEAVRHVL